MQKRFGDNLSPSIKYWIFLVGIIVSIFGVIFGSFVASYLYLPAEEQELASELFSKLLAFPFLGSMLLVVIICTLVSLIFQYYIIPVLRMAEQTRLITITNPDHRVVTKGAKELRILASVINESADAYQALQREVDERVKQVNRDLKQERNRFAALMSELPNGVVVCNTDGLVLLYNPVAQEMLEGGQGTGATIGLGRSIFSLLDREPLVHALEWINHEFALGKAKPLLGLMTAFCGERFIRVNMAATTSQDNDEPAITGFVLTLEDITDEIEAGSERDLQLQDLIDAVQGSLGNIHQGITEICEMPGVGTEACNHHRQAIAQVSNALEEHLAMARNLYSSHLKAYGNRESVLTDTLLAIMARKLDERFALTVEVGSSQPLWVKIDSYAIVETITNLGGLLKAEQDIDRLELACRADQDRSAGLVISWDDRTVPVRLLQDWQTSPLFRGFGGQFDSPRSIITHHGGEIRIEAEHKGLCERLVITLPTALTGETEELHSRVAPRPVSYEFDLFHQPGQQALGQVPLRKLAFVAFDTETTGLKPSEGDEIIQLGAVRIVNSRLLMNEVIDQLVDPQRPVPPSSVAIHGIRPELLPGQPTINEVLPSFHAFTRDAVLVAHNAAFDMRFLQLKEEATGLHFDNPVLDTLLLSSVVHPNQEGHALENIAERLNIRIVGRHTAFGDALVTAEVLLKLLPLLEAQGIVTLADAIEASANSRFARLKY